MMSWKPIVTFPKSKQEAMIIKSILLNAKEQCSLLGVSSDLNTNQTLLKKFYIKSLDLLLKRPSASIAKILITD